MEFDFDKWMGVLDEDKKQMNIMLMMKRICIVTNVII